MLLTINCPQCNHLLGLDEQYVGRPVRCPACQATFTIQPPEPLLAEPVEVVPELLPAEQVTSDLVPSLPLAPRSHSLEPPAAPPLRRSLARRGPAGCVRFTVRVLDDSHDELAGTVEAETGGDGLELRVEDYPVLFAPIGTPAEQPGPNEVILSFSGRRLHLQVTKRVRGKRLAHDLVRFLRGKRGPLEPSDYRLPEALVVLGVGLLLTAAILVGIVWVVRSVRAVPRIDESAWKEFHPPGARCRLLMPGSVVTRQQPIPGLKQPMTIYAVKVNRPNSAFGFAYMAFSRQELGHVPLNDRFEGARQGMLAQVQGATFVSQRDITLNGHPGREYVMDVEKRGKMTIRIYVVDGRHFYMLMAGGDRFEPDTPDVVKFFDSFVLFDRRACA